LNGLIVYDHQRYSIASAPFIREQLHKLDEMAMKNIQEFSNNGYTGPELLAIKIFEMLALTREYDLANIILRGQLINEIKTKNLWTVYPETFANASEAIAAKCGISRTQQSNIEALNNYIFPYIENELGMSLPDFWTDISPTNLTEIVPHLMQIITGKTSKSAKVRDQLEKVYGEVGDAENKDRAAIEQLVEVARGTKEDLRKALREVHTPPIDAVVLKRGDRMWLFARLDDDQLKMLYRIAGDHVEFAYGDLEKEDYKDIQEARKLLEFIVEV
jgi:hypothetical protein